MRYPYMCSTICGDAVVPDNAAEPRKELRPLHNLGMSGCSGLVHIIPVARLQGLYGGLLHKLGVACRYLPDNPFILM